MILIVLALLSSNLSGGEPSNPYLSSINSVNSITLSDVFNFKSKSVGMLNFSDLARDYLLEENNYYGTLVDFPYGKFNLEARLLGKTPFRR